MSASRYKVVTTHGFWTARQAGRASSTPHVTAAVLDRAFCYRVVASWRSERAAMMRHNTRGGLSAREYVVAQAERLAAGLNGATHRDAPPPHTGRPLPPVDTR